MLKESSLEFLDQLERNNNRDWFQSQAATYKQYKSDYFAFAEELLAEVKKFDESVANLDSKKVVFRINRDIRFSKDKSPYKTHMGFWISPRESEIPKAGYYLHVSRKESFIAGGIYAPEAKELKKIRTEIAYFYDDLRTILDNNAFKKTFGDLHRDETALKLTPKGFEKEHVANKYLQLKSFIVQQKISISDVTKTNFVKQVAEKFLLIKPLNDFLNRSFDVADQ